MNRWGNKHWPLIMAIGILYLTLAVTLTKSISKNQGQLVYALDDAYIHMAMAKNFARHGVWGITKHGFTSSSSSPLWTLLLSLGYRLFGINAAIPFILNIVFGTLICILAYRLLERYGLSPFFSFVILSGIIFFTPLPVLIFSGMEHTLHTLLTICFVYLSAKVLPEENTTSLESLLLLILAPFLIMARYEGMFLVFVVSVLSIVKRKRLYALTLGGFSMLPVVIYGLFSVSRGWHFLPNSVLLKGGFLDLYSLKDIISYYLFNPARIVAKTPYILMFILGISIAFYFQYSKQKETSKDAVFYMNIILLATTLLHVQFARSGYFYRYEAYLIALGILVIGISFSDSLPKNLQSFLDKKSIIKSFASTGLIFILVGPFVSRGVSALKKIPQATTNIYEQQYQMGLFIREFYQGKAVALNDIGAISYLADIDCLDLSGLGNREVGKAKRENRYTGQKIDELAKTKHVSLAILYEHWFLELPLQWIRVGQWKILNNVICGSDIVSFYATNLAEKDVLIANLRQFARQLPPNVIQGGMYNFPIQE